MKVLTLSTLTRSGAGIGSMRRVEALRNYGVDVDLVSLITDREESYVGRIIPAIDGYGLNEAPVWQLLVEKNKKLVRSNKSYQHYELFSLNDSLLHASQLKPLFDQYDLLHFHWVVGMLDYPNLAEVVGSKPVVWTTADMFPFTGGCHYSGGCEGFTQACEACPVFSGESDLPALAFQEKKAAYSEMNITVVCPSEHMARIVRSSSLFRENRIEVIPNAYPVNDVMPMDNEQARDALSLPKDKKLIMVAAESLDNRRKGGDLIAEVSTLLEQTRYANQIEFVTVGKEPLELSLATTHLGTLGLEKLCQAFSASDLFLSLSREDVGPMTIVESLLCGTPVVGFAIGVLPEVVMPEITGDAVKPFDTDDVVKSILYFLNQKSNDPALSMTCRSSAIRYASPERSAVMHYELYRSLLN